MRTLHCLDGRWPFVILGCLLALKIAVAAIVPLVGDEAYYALWSRAWSWGYHDHPPMVALFIRAGTALWGEVPVAVRLLAILSGLPTAALVWATALLVARD